METRPRRLGIQVNWKLNGADSRLAKAVAVVLLVLYGILGTWVVMR